MVLDVLDVVARGTPWGPRSRGRRGELYRGEPVRQAADGGPKGMVPYLPFPVVLSDLVPEILDLLDEVVFADRFDDRSEAFSPRSDRNTWSSQNQNFAACRCSSHLPAPQYGAG